MKTKISINIAPVDGAAVLLDMFVLAITDAPKSYDGFGTLTAHQFGYPLEDSHLRTKHNARLVLIREEHLDWHQGRYGSGMYCCHVEKVGDVFYAEHISELLFKRLSHPTPEE